MVEVRRKEGETTGAMLRRFTRRVQLSGILVRSRKTRFHQSRFTKRLMRERALRKIKKAKEMNRLEKLGKLKKEER